VPRTHYSTNTLAVRQKNKMRKKFYKNIIFSKTPLTGHFRFGDYFQIYPCDFENAPKSEHASDIPLVIEFWIDEDENPEVSEDLESMKSFISPTTNQTNKLNRLTRLLSAITNHRFFNNSETELKWGSPLPDDIEADKEKFNQTSSSLILGFYYYPQIGDDLKITSFSEQRHEDVKLIDHRLYYRHDPIEDKKKEITFPHTINQLLDKYFSFESKAKKIVDTICHLICNGIDIQSKMKSISFLCFVSSIETLVNFEYKDKKDGVEFECHDCQTLKSSPITCKKCSRPIWGVKAKFKSFLKTYVAYSENAQTKFNRVYNLRSNIVHSGMLLLGDEQIDWTKSEKANSEYMTHIETMQLARLALVNWMLMGPNKERVE
jgi:hypothetical protein